MTIEHPRLRTSVATFAVLIMGMGSLFAASNAAHGKEEEKTHVPHATKPDTANPADPKIAALVKEMEDPVDPAKRAKAFDALLMLGEPGVTAVKESLSCRGAQVRIEATVAPQTAPPNTPIKVEFFLKNAGASTLWVPASSSNELLFSVSEPGDFHPFSTSFVKQLESHKEPALPKGANPIQKEGTHPLAAWKPARAGETISGIEVTRKVPAVGFLYMSARTSIPIGKEEPGSLFPFRISTASGKQKIDFEIGSSLNPGDLATHGFATLYAIPDLENLPHDGPATIEIAVTSPDLPAKESHVEFTVTVSNPSQDASLMLEDNFLEHVWVHLIGDDGVQRRREILDSIVPPTGDIRETLSRKYVLLGPGGSFQAKANLLRPAKVGSYRILVGYEIGKGEGETEETRTSTFNSHLAYKKDAPKLDRARLYAISQPIRIATNFEWDLPPLQAGEPPDPKEMEPISRRMIDATWINGLTYASRMQFRTGEIMAPLGDQFIQDMRLAMLHARTLPDTDLTKLLIYYHCGEALIAQSKSKNDRFDRPLMVFAVNKAVELADAQLTATDALRPACRLAQAEMLVLAGNFAEAAPRLKTAQELLEKTNSGLPWDWVRLTHLQMQIHTATGAASKALRLYHDNLVWLRLEFGLDSKAEGQLAIDALAAATALKDAEAVKELTERVGALTSPGHFPRIESRTAPTFIDKGNELIQEKKFVEAEKVFLQAFQAGAADPFSWHDERNATYALVGLLGGLEQWDRCLKYQLRALAYNERAYDRTPESIFGLLCNAGDCYTRLGQIEKARPYLDRATNVLRGLKNLTNIDPGFLEFLKDWFERHP